MGSASRQREGEWSCSCGFPSNRPYRAFCHACQRPRASAEVINASGGKGGGSRGAVSGKGHKGGRAGMVGEGNRWGGGPLGADGTRPLLGGRCHQMLEGPAGKGRSKGSAGGTGGDGKGLLSATPTGKAAGDRVARANGSAWDFGKGRSGVGVDEGGKDGRGKGGNAWARPSPVVDSEGYELVQPRRVRVVGCGSHGGGAEGGTVPTGRSNDATTPAAARRLWSDEDSDDGDMDDDEAGGDGDEGGAGDDKDWQPDPRQLRAEFEELARATRDMERRGTGGPALDTLRQARDDAEKRWRDAKPPAPLPRRLEWAEAKVRKAQASLTRERLELDRLDEAFDARRADQCRRIEEAEGWYKWRKQQLEQVHQEAAGLAPGGRDGRPADGGAGRVSRRIRGQMLPEMQAILEELQEGTSLHERMALLVAGLADAEAQLGAADQGGATHYDLYDGDSQEGGWGEHHQGYDDEDGDNHQDNGIRGGVSAERAAGWRPEGPGRWSRACAAQAQAGPSDAAAGHTLSQRAEGGSSDGGAATTACGDDRAGGSDTTARPDRTDDTGERAGKHRRRQTEVESSDVARKEDDARRAQELRRQIENATAAQTQSYREGNGGFGSEAALSAAAQRFVMDVQRAQAQAGEMGIEPRAEDGRMLLELSPAELRRWVAEHLDNDGMRD